MFIFYRTGLVFDSSLLEEKNVGSTLRIAYDKLKQVTCNRFVQLTVINKSISLFYRIYLIRQNFVESRCQRG